MSELVRSIPASWYFDPEIFRKETANIFGKHWNFVTHANALSEAGQFVTETVAGQGIVLVSTETKINGFLNVCRHRASPVCHENRGALTQFTCPYHSWSYDLDGKLINTPGFEESLEKDHFGLFPIRVEIWNGLVFVCLCDQAPNLIEWLGDLPELAAQYPTVSEMEFHCVRVNGCEANWKSYSDNSAEGYHLGSIHPRLSRSLVKNQTSIRAYENGKFVGFNVRYKREQEGDEDSPGLWVYKFPGLLIHFSMTGFNIERVIAIDERRASMQRWFWFKPEVSENERDETIQFSNEVMEEDMGICSKVQKNLESGFYTTGVLSPQREPGTIFFQKCVQEALSEVG